MATNSSLREHALQYAAQGWRVLPVNTVKDGVCSCGTKSCGSAGKHPRIAKWTEKATNNPDQIEKWWSQWPNSNVGIATGEASNLFVLDVDGEKGTCSLQNWLLKFDWTPDTMTAITGRGKHFYFLHPGFPVKNSAGHIAPGIDIRGEGGFVVAPPSVHMSGTFYRFEQPNAAVSCAPSWLLEMLSGQRSQNSEANPANEKALIAVGTRNETLFKKGCSLRARGLEEEQIREELMRINETQCEVPVTPEEVAQAAQNAAKYDKGVASSAFPGDDKRLFWFPFDVNEYWLANRNVLYMTEKLRSRYMFLLAEAWKDGGKLPKDPEQLYKLSRAEDGFKKFLADMPKLMEPFKDFGEVGDNGPVLVHLGMEKLYGDQLVKHAKCKLAGKKSADLKKQNKGSVPVEIEEGA